MATNEPLDGVAIVGMAGRFPGASSIDAFWANLAAGRESITRFTPEQLSPLVPASLANHPRYVPARGVLADADRFDNGFFGISPREALLIDPQQRVFLELCWNALEHACIDPSRADGSIGVYAGTSNNTYRKSVELREDLLRAAGEFAQSLASEKDYVATRVAHRMDLRGPAISIHTACSTSLVSVVQAWYALMSGQCDVALAGGINIVVPQESGHLPIEGGIESDDGHCRPFDADASGTVFSCGGAAVVLKRLGDAIEQGDTIWSVIRGVAVNNDGGDKASFSAPSVRGQAAVIRDALDSAGVSAESIDYVEAHGTGTALGDPIEVAALTRAFRMDTQQREFCWLGSVKGNLGHLNAASGVAGLIKAVLALHHGQIPPTLHYRRPNPEIDFASGPFKVADRLIAWPRGAEPRRAGVSSFGVGGTNAHVVLEEAPLPLATTSVRRFTLLPLSARDDAALQRRASDLATALIAPAAPALADIGYTLTLGRQPMAVRGFVVAGDADDARTRLSSLRAQTAETTSPPLVFLFPGQGSQHAGMARELVDSEPVFRDAFEHCCTLASACLGRDLRALILPEAGAEEHATAALAETRYAQPALFAVEYALAVLWESWGLHPTTMIGHSIGEYVAACRAGVFSVDDAVALVVARGAAMFAQPPGAMLAVRVGADELAPRLPPGVEIAGYNTPSLAVVSGSADVIEAFAAALATEDIASTRLHVSHAFHSVAMDAALPVFRRAFEGLSLQAPQQPFYSCVSGAPIHAEEATSVDYWCRQLRQPVRFADAVQHVLANERALFLEVGPSQALSGLVRTMLDGRGRSVASLAPAVQAGRADEQVQRALGECWCAGVTPDWMALHAGQVRRRVPLPGYPFQGKRYWVESSEQSAKTMSTQEKLVMQESALSVSTAPAVAAPQRSARLADELRAMVESLTGEVLLPAQDVEEFLSLGLDSLTLTQATLEIERRYGVKLKFRRLMEDLGSVATLAAMLDQTLPAEVVPVVRVAAVLHSASTPAATIASAVPAALDQTMLGQLIQSQMALMNQQTELLRSLSGQTAIPASVAAATAPAPVEAAPSGGSDEAAPANLVERPFGASARIVTSRQGELTQAQRVWVDGFSRDYSARTGKSKAFSQQHRLLMADPRVVTGFNPLWKELTYPIVVDRSAGAKLWDLDGNEYIDLLNGFGVNFLGYQPDYITAALHAQIDAGMEIGPQHPLSAEVAQLINDLTGMPRVAFCNTGSEAVMGAMRIARTVTGRKTIVIFKDSYHGIFDEVIVRGTRTLRSIAAAPGILASAVENVLVLDYGSDEALRIIRERAHELAAVMIEPVQSKHPTLQPHAFVHELRELCDDGGCALIFDEVITGFRMAPGGAQEYYGVRADIATYGKIIGGGLPFAAIAGAARWMDALDGGHWQFGDESYPEAGVTYFAGTFVRHPLALAAAHAALSWVKQQGPALQAGLNARTAGLIDQLNAVFKSRHAPLTALGYSSLWRVLVDEDQPCASLFWYRLRHEGLHVYEQFNCFLSVAHGDAEVARIVGAVTAAVDALMEGGVLTRRQMAHAEMGKPLAAIHISHDPTATAPVSDPAALLPVAVALTEGQQEKWLACQYDEAANVAFNESMALRLHGPLDIAALKQSLALLWSRHEAFRLSFAADGRSQRFNADVSLPLQELDYAIFDEDAEARFDSFCEEQMRLPFDTTRAPLVRFNLVRFAEHSHALHVISHHLVMDGWSVAVFMDELAKCYNACSAGLIPQLSAADSFRAYALAENKRRAATDELEYWANLYSVLPEPLQLPTDRGASAQPDFSAATVRHEFPAALAAALKREAARQGVSLYALLLSAFGVLLARLSGQHDFAIGIPFAGQARGGAAALLGDGVNTLPLRMAAAADCRFAELVKRTQVALLDAAEHQDVSLMSILRVLGLRRQASSAALTGVIFNFNPPLSGLAFQGLQYELHDCAHVASVWELFFNLNDTGRTLTLDLHYATARYDEQTMCRWISVYETLLGAIANGVEGCVGTLPLLDAQGMSMASATGLLTSDAGGPATVLAMFESQAARTPQRVAVECGVRTVTYAQLHRQVADLAAQLRSGGVQSGDLVGVCVDRSEDMVVAVLGVMKSGAAYVPLDPTFPAERLRYMADHSQLRHVVATTVESVPAVIAEGHSLLILGELDHRQAEPVSEVEITGADLAYVLYTSGSTGNPKGVRICHRNLVNFLESMLSEPGVDAGDVLCAVTTLSFDIAGLELYLPLVAGARVLVATEDQCRDPHALLALMRERGVTMLQTTPSLLRLLGEQDRHGILSRIKLLVGGEELPRRLASSMARQCRELWNMYGPTETTIWSTCARIDTFAGAVPLGHPIRNTRIHILDGLRQPVPQGVIGEIWIGGRGVADGYLFEPELTAERFCNDPFADDGTRMYRTGDLGTLREGVLYFHGRIDHQVKLRGYRIELGDIEAAALAQPDVSEAVAAVRQFGENDERLVLYAVPKNDAPLFAERLREHLRERLPKYMLPQHIERMPSLPQTPNGKVDRKALPQPAAATSATILHEKATSVTPASLTDPQEKYLATIWRELIGVDDVRSADNFFDLGGHSLLAVEFTTRVQREKAVHLKLMDVATGTLASLAVELSRAASARDSRSLFARLRRRLGLG